MRLFDDESLLSNNLSSIFDDNGVFNILLLEVLQEDCVKNIYNSAEIFTEYQKYTVDSLQLKFVDILNNVNHHLHNIVLKYKDLCLNKKQIIDHLNYLVATGNVFKDIGIGCLDEYTYVPKIMRKSSRTKSYREIKVVPVKRILLLSDLHIGNPLVDYNELKRKLDTIIQMNAYDHVFILGDLFEGVNKNSLDLSNQKVIDSLERQIEIFNYVLPNDIKITVFLGNHDESIDLFLQNKYGLINGDIRMLSLLKPNVSFIQDYEFGNIIDISNLRLSCSHPLRYNSIVNYVKTYELESPTEILLNMKNYNHKKVNLVLSGHLHMDYHEYIDDYNGMKEEVQVIPPLFMNDGNIGYFLELHYDDEAINEYDLVPIQIDSKTISFGEENRYSINNCNSSLVRIRNDK